MRFIVRIILRILANALAIFVAAKLIDQVTFTGDLVDYLMVGLILAVANIIVRPVLKIVSAPLIFITMGLFSLVINLIILFVVDWFVESLSIAGLWGYIWGTIIISIFNALITVAKKKKTIIEG